MNYSLIFVRSSYPYFIYPMKPFFSILFSLTFVLVFWQSAQPVKYHPRPTDRAEEQEEGASHEAEREEYIENMHRTAPGVNWHEIEMQNAKALNLARSLQAKTTSNDTIAGNIIGEWQEVGSKNQAGRVLFAEYNPSTHDVFAAADGGSIWKGKDDGTGWLPLTHDFQIPNVHYMKNYSLPSGANRIVVAANNNKVDGIFYKDDNDPIWHTPTGVAYNTIKDNGRVFQCVANPTKIYLLATDSTEYALYESSDFGETFSRIVHLSFFVMGNASQIDIWTDEDSNGDLYVIGKNKCYKVVNNQLVVQGTIAASGPSKENLCGATINGTTYLYAHLLNNNANNLYVSANGGVNWTYKGTQTNNMFMQNSLGCSSTQPNLLFWGAVDSYRSTDAGTSWTTINNWYEYYDFPATKLHADIPCARSFPKGNGETTVITTDGGIFVSQDGGINFQNITLSGLQNAQYYDTYTHPTQTNYVWAGAQDQGFQRANTVGTGLRNFTQLISGDYGQIGSGDGGYSLWAVYPGFAMFYDNYQQVSYAGSWDFTMTGNLWIPPLMVEPNDPITAHIAGGKISGTGNYLVTLEYGSGNVMATQEPYNFLSPITAIKHSLLNTDYRFVTTDNGKFFVSTNKGQNWTNPSGGMPDGHYFYGNALLPSPSILNRVIVGGSGYNNPAVYASDNLGQTFYPMNNGLPATLVYDLACTPGEGLIFAATEAGPYVYKAADAKWYYLGGTSAPAETYWSVEYIPALKTARFGTYGRGIWDFVLDPSSLTKIEQSSEISLQLYPNPNQGTFHIKGENLIASEIQCAVFDASGKQVAEVCAAIGSAPDDILIQIENLHKGLYFVEIRNEKKRWRKGERLIID